MLIHGTSKDLKYLRKDTSVSVKTQVPPQVAYLHGDLMYPVERYVSILAQCTEAFLRGEYEGLKNKFQIRL